MIAESRKYLAMLLKSEASHNAEIADEMVHFAGLCRGSGFATALRNQARRHRVRAIELHSTAAALAGDADA